MNRSLGVLIGGAVVIISSAVMMACNGKGASEDGSSAAALTISGGFSSLSLMSLPQGEDSVSLQAVTDYVVSCSMLVAPYSNDYKNLDANGAFALSIAGAVGQPIGCMLIKSGSLIGAFEFETTNSETGAALPVNSGTTTISLPTTLTVNSTSKSITVPASGISQNSSTPPAVSWVDPTGTWTISQACNLELDKATGALNKNCMTPDQTGGKIPSSVYLKTVTATNGSGDVKTGLSIWESAAARTACGDKEGVVDLPAGYTAVGGWNGAFTGGVTLDLSTLTAVNSAATYAIAQVWNGKAVCDKTAASPGTTKCSQITWTGGGWGMSAEACKLYCVLGAINNGKNENGVSQFDWTGYNGGSPAACKKRYRMNWQYNNELAADTDHNSNNGTSAGSLADGKCDAGGDGCYETGKEILVPEDRGPDSRFMFNVFHVSGNVGTLIEKKHTGKHNFQNAAQNGQISCGGTFIEKMTMVQTSGSAGQISVERTFIADLDNNLECATNSDFERMSSDTESFVLQVSK